MAIIRRYLILTIVIFLLILHPPIFVVKEGERGIRIRFGKVVRYNKKQPLIYQPGLHFKIPFIESVKKLDARIKTTNTQADRFVTKEKKDLIVDSYIKWHISDFSRYYLATGGGDISQAETLLKRKFSDRLRSEIGRLNVEKIVTVSRNYLTKKVCNILNNGFMKAKENILKKENQIFNLNSMSALGIKIIDVRIKRISLPTEVSEAIYKRMRAEREAVARRHRSQGQEEAEKLRATADYKVTKTLSEAERVGLILRGEGDAKSARLFAKAFNQDPEFYIFIRSLRAYVNSFKKNQDLMILNAKSSFFQYMKVKDKKK